MSKLKTEKQQIQSKLKTRKRRARLNHKLNHAEFIMSKARRNLHKAIMNTAKPIKPKYKNDEITLLKEWR